MKKPLPPIVYGKVPPGECIVVIEDLDLKIRQAFIVPMRFLGRPEEWRKTFKLVRDV